MKKVYSVYLDQDSVDIVQPYLEKQGLSFSGFVNQAVVEYGEALKNMDLPEDVSKMTLGDFVKMFSRMVKSMRDDPKP